MEHNLAMYAKYYSYGNTKISGGGEFIRETNHSRRDFSSKCFKKLYFELGTFA
jgi:hypothetical protein